MKTYHMGFECVNGERKLSRDSSQPWPLSLNQNLSFLNHTEAETGVVFLSGNVKIVNTDQ